MLDLVENKWTNPYTGVTAVTVKYTDKTKVNEMIKEYKELYPEMEQMLKPSKCYIQGVSSRFYNF